jgi:hypothetical protein
MQAEATGIDPGELPAVLAQKCVCFSDALLAVRWQNVRVFSLAISMLYSSWALGYMPVRAGHIIEAMA